MNGAVWALICAFLWTAGMLYFDYRKKRNN